MAESPIDEERHRLERELARLEMKRRALDEALGEFLHEGRRTRDALERAGGHSRTLDARARLLKKNAAMTRRDLERTEREIESLKRRLAQLEGSG